MADADIDTVWSHIKARAGQRFHTKTGLSFIYEVPGTTSWSDRANWTLSQTNFCKSFGVMPAIGPGAIKDRQGSVDPRAILMDERIRHADG